MTLSYLYVKVDLYTHDDGRGAVDAGILGNKGGQLTVESGVHDPLRSDRKLTRRRHLVTELGARRFRKFVLSYREFVSLRFCLVA